MLREPPAGKSFCGTCHVAASAPRHNPHRMTGADGTLDIVAEDPQGTLLAAPTNICFVGDALDRVVAANLGRWHLTLLDLGLIGAPLPAPDRWAVDAA